MELTKIEFENGQKVSDAYVEIDGVKHNVTKAQYTGKTPLSARNLNLLQENIGNAISDLDERVVSYRNVLVDEQALIKECGGLKLKALNKLVGKTEQEVREGYNLLDTSEIKTVKNQNGEDRQGYYCEIKETGSYYILLNTTNTMYFGKSTNLDNATTLIGSTTANYETTYDFNAGDFFVIWGTKVDTDKLMVSLEKRDFEAYGKAPTPNFPSEVKTVTGNVEAYFCNKNFAYDVVYKNPSVQYYPTVDVSYKLSKGSYYIMSFDTENTGQFVYANQGETYGYRRVSSNFNTTCNGTRKHWVIQALDSLEHKGLSLVNKNENNSINTGYTYNLMIEKIPATTDEEALTYLPTDYVEHQGETYPLTLGDIEVFEKSYFYPKNGKWYIYDEHVKEFAKNYLQIGSVNNLGTHTRFTLKFQNQCKGASSKSYCNYLKYLANYSEQSEHFYVEKGVDGYGYAYVFVKNEDLISTDIAGVEDFIAKHSDLYFIYQLATPTDTEITDTTLIAQLNALENAMLYEGITNISITGDNLTPIADIDYWTWFKGESGESSNVYSTEEQVIGKWIDGKPIYRKVYQTKYDHTAGYTMIFNQESTIETVVDAYGWIGYTNGFHKIGGYANENYYSLFQRNVASKQLAVYGTNNYNGNDLIVIVEYTKTTD